MVLEQLEHARDHIHAAPLGLDEPGLVVDAGRDHVDVAAVQRLIRREQALLACPVFDAARDLPVCALHAVAQANRLDAAVVLQAQVFIAIGLA